jgi:hypothetical protein
MLDQIESQIAYRLSQKHNYPFSQNIYQNIFRSFSHFPLQLSEIGLTGPGKTITYMALVVYKCFETDGVTLINLYQNVLEELQPLVQPFYPQDCTVETLLGTSLFYSHPSSINNDLCQKEITDLFNDKQLYEFQLKIKTISLNIF